MIFLISSIEIAINSNQITQPDHISSLIITHHHTICHDFPREKSMETERENYKMHADVEEPNQKNMGCSRVLLEESKNLCAISCLETASCFYWHVRIRNNFAHGILVFWETFRKTSRKSWGALRPLDSFRNNMECGENKETIADATSSLWHSSMLPARLGVSFPGPLGLKGWSSKSGGTWNRCAAGPEETAALLGRWQSENRRQFRSAQFRWYLRIKGVNLELFTESSCRCMDVEKKQDLEWIWRGPEDPFWPIWFGLFWNRPQLDEMIWPNCNRTPISRAPTWYLVQNRWHSLQS